MFAASTIYQRRSIARSSSVQRGNAGTTDNRPCCGPGGKYRTAADSNSCTKWAAPSNPHPLRSADQIRNRERRKAAQKCLSLLGLPVRKVIEQAASRRPRGADQLASGTVREQAPTAVFTMCLPARRSRFAAHAKFLPASNRSLHTRVLFQAVIFNQIRPVRQGDGPGIQIVAVV